mmetsp:Transcript_6199/g.16038  ORF Transcript_6199/g.16038 Transcript_6199/m.16038 type:complete len:184 (+) Transcript_6199:158-709(+)
MSSISIPGPKSADSGKAKNTSAYGSWNADSLKPKMPTVELPTVKSKRFGPMGPALAMGIGCGAGIGLGVTGAMGVGIPVGLHLGFGVGAGCGVGIGYGYGYGTGRAYEFDGKSSQLKRKPGRTNLFASLTALNPWMRTMDVLAEDNDDRDSDSATAARRRRQRSRRRVFGNSNDDDGDDDDRP